MSEDVPRRRLARAAVAALLLAGCRTEADEAVRAEAGRVAHQIKVLRDAPNAEKAPQLAALDRTACTAADVCALKSACHDAYELELQALSSVATVRHAVQEAAAPPPGAGLVLSKAEAELGRAKNMETRCADLEGALRRRYRL